MFLTHAVVTRTDITGVVHVGKEDLNVIAGDQGVMFGYSSDVSEDCMLLTHAVATRPDITRGARLCSAHWPIAVLLQFVPRQ